MVTDKEVKKEYAEVGEGEEEIQNDLLNAGLQNVKRLSLHFF